MNDNALQTSWTLLRKVPFRETSLIVSGISPDYGRIDFMIRGARSISRSKFPEAELFREFHLVFHGPSGESGLCRMQSLEMTVNHDAVANHIRSYCAACDLSAFLLRHTHVMLELPHTWRALNRMLTALETREEPEPFSSLTKLVFLYENGYVPESDRGKLADILLFAEDASAPRPQGSAAYWKRLCDWIGLLVKFHSLEGADRL